jgi:hypothetical protein
MMQIRGGLDAAAKATEVRHTADLLAEVVAPPRPPADG